MLATRSRPRHLATKGEEIRVTFSGGCGVVSPSIHRTHLLCIAPSAAAAAAAVIRGLGYRQIDCRVNSARSSTDDQRSTSSLSSAATAAVAVAVRRRSSIRSHPLYNGAMKAR